MTEASCPLILSPDTSDFETHFRVYHELMSVKVQEILLVSSPYDAFILEEDQSLASKIINEYRGLNLSRPPRVFRAHSAEEALAALSKRRFDLVLTLPVVGGADAFSIALAIKKARPALPVVLLAHSLSGVHPAPPGKDCSGIDRIYVWHQDSDLILSVVKNTEDALNADADTAAAMVRVLILVEDSPVYRSFLLPLIYREVVRQTRSVIEESVNEEHRLLKMRARPKILMAETYEEAENLFCRFRPYVFGVISDTRFPREGKEDPQAGVALMSMVKEAIPHLPLLLMSSEPGNREWAEDLGVRFMDKNTPDLAGLIHEYFTTYLGFGDLVFRDRARNEIGRATSLATLEEAVVRLSEEPFLYQAHRNRFANWAMSRSEVVLARRLTMDRLLALPSVEQMKAYVAENIHCWRKWRQRGEISRFSPQAFDPTVTEFVKLGTGSLGGKSRSLAFMSRLLRESEPEFRQFGGVEITVPGTFVITTEVFDDFIEKNRLGEDDSADAPDDEVIRRFLSARLPGWVEQNLLVYVKKVGHPLSVRSSSQFEDSHDAAFAGLYETVMLPNDHPDPVERARRLSAAVKAVYASAFFGLARKLSRGSGRYPQKDRMAVIIQQLAGRRFDGCFYPAVSGVLRSHNFYPVPPMQPEDGIAHIAMGFGRIITEQNGGLRFSPAHPAVMPQFSTVEDILQNAQRSFYALKFGAEDPVSRFERANLELKEVAGAADEPYVRALCSFYDPAEDRLRDGFRKNAHPVLTFAPLLKHKTVPLADLLALLSRIGQKGMGGPMEMEFSLDLPMRREEPARMSLLQMRPLVSGEEHFSIEITRDEKQRAFLYSETTLGHGVNMDMADVVYVGPDAFRPEATRETAAEIGKVNARLASQGRPYLLIGPGRWGTRDPWLGIPVSHRDVSFARAMVEVRGASLSADPSYGSHFFDHITRQGVYYIIVDEAGPEFVRWETLDAFPPAGEHRYVRHAYADSPFKLKIDGRKGRCVIL